MKTKLIHSFFFATLIAACSPAPLTIARSSSDPSSPSAQEGRSPLPTVSLVAPVLASAPVDHSQHADHSAHVAMLDAGNESVVYVCPMHPEVTSTSPGQLCPKCNMKLVPKE